MKLRLIKSRKGITCLGAAIVFGLLLIGVSGHRLEVTRTARADEKGPKCTLHNLDGSYATRGDGFIPSGPPPAPMLPFAEVGLMTLDGNGALTHDVTTSNNGFILQDFDQGTYTVNENCKGTMTINIPVPPFQLNFDMVVVDEGKSFNLIATTPSVVTVGGRRFE